MRQRIHGCATIDRWRGSRPNRSAHPTRSGPSRTGSSRSTPSTTWSSAGRCSEPGWHWATDVKPIAGTPSCQYHHLGVCVSGRLGIRMDDGTTFEIGPNTVFDIPAGHDGWVIGDEPWETYDVAGMRAFGRELDADDRVLATILFTDVVDSTAIAERMGDARWRPLISTLNERCRVRDRPPPRAAHQDHRRRRHRPVRRLRAGRPLCGGVDRGRARARAGPARRRSTRARSSWCRATSAGWPSMSPRASCRWPATATSCLSATTRELIAGSNLAFEDKGEHELKGISGARRVYALARSADDRSGAISSAS